MKTKSREALSRLVGLLLMVVVVAGTMTTEVEAAQTEVLAAMNAGAATVLDSINVMTEEELAEYAAEYEEKYSLVMANVRESMNIRQEPSADSAKIGLLYADCGGTILERGDGWTKIQSGNLIGWASNDYLLFGEEALQLAEQVGVYNATVHASGLNIRKEPSTEAAIWDQVNDGEVYEAVMDYTTDEWVAIEYGGALGYISADYVTLEFTIDHGETLEEIKEREIRERKERQKLIVKEGTSVIGTTDDMLLAALIYMEAGNQPYEGQVAVGAVVMNRVNSGAYPNTIAGVIYASGQFTPTVTGRVEELAVSGVPESCLQAARAAMNGESTVGGAMHFRRAGRHEGQVIGDHVFW
ncbi:MAG: cell wall hydrolase [Lachnospiraceae bacterium]